MFVTIWNNLDLMMTCTMVKQNWPPAIAWSAQLSLVLLIDHADSMNGI